MFGGGSGGCVGVHHGSGTNDTTHRGADGIFIAFTTTDHTSDPGPNSQALPGEEHSPERLWMQSLLAWVAALENVVKAHGAEAAAVNQPDRDRGGAMAVTDTRINGQSLGDASVSLRSLSGQLAKRAGAGVFGWTAVGVSQAIDGLETAADFLEEVRHAYVSGLQPSVRFSNWD